jgi:hypothetical protein
VIHVLRIILLENEIEKVPAYQVLGWPTQDLRAAIIDQKQMPIRRCLGDTDGRLTEDSVETLPAVAEFLFRPFVNA